MASPRSFLFSAGVDKTVYLVSVREALFCTYVPVKCRQLFALSRAHSPGVPGRKQTTDNRQRAQRYNAVLFVIRSYFLQHLSLHERVSAKRQVVDTGSPSRHMGRDPGATPAFWNAWQVLKVVFYREWKRLFSLVSVREALFCTYVPVQCCLFFALLLSVGSHEHTAPW